MKTFIIQKEIIKADQDMYLKYLMDKKLMFKEVFSSAPRVGTDNFPNKFHRTTEN